MAGKRESYIFFSDRKEVEYAKKVVWYFGVFGTKNCPDWYEDGEEDRWLKTQDGPYAFHGECHNGHHTNPKIWYEFNWNLPGEEG